MTRLMSLRHQNVDFDEYSRQYETVSIIAIILLESEPSSLRFPDVDESQTLEEELNLQPPPDHTRVIHNSHPIGISSLIPQC
jgi:hypothetical protein